MFGLTFLNAGILIATIATLVPLLIHLFIKNKPQKVFFSSLKFLKEIIEERKKKMTLNQLLLLILRMLIILFTIFAISRPVLKLPFVNRANFHPPTAIAFILDTSPSMDYVIDQKTQIQHGIDIIKNIQSEMNNRDASYFLTSDAMQNSLRSRLIYGLIPERDFHEISFTWTPEPLDRLINQAQIELEKSRFLHKEIYVISDMQQAELPKELSIPVSFISTFTDSIRVNLSIENAVVKKELIAGTLQRIAEFEVVNHSPLHQRDQIVRLHINGTTVAEKMVDLQPYERKTDFFAINNESLEWNWGWVEVRNDRFLPDNRYFFTFYSDPEPKIGIIVDSPQRNVAPSSDWQITNNRNMSLPRPIEILAEIFIGDHGQLEYIQTDNLQLSDRDKYHFFIFYLTNYNSRIQALIRDLNATDYQCMFILHPSINEDSRRFFQTNYGLEFTTLSNRRLQSINAFHRWHRIISDFDFTTQLNLQAAPALAIGMASNNSPLVNTEITPLVIENKDIFINIDFSTTGQNFLSHPSFPIILYRSFSWISKYDGAMNSYLIGDTSRHNQGLLTSPAANEYDASNQSFRFSEPGIWTYIDGTARNSSFLAINMFDFENQSRHNPMTDIDIENVNLFGTDFQGQVLQQDSGNEIWKLLLWSVLVFLLIEMALVLLLQKKARVK